MRKLAKQPIRVGLISLGCAKNLVDAEVMLGALLKEGVEITNDAAAADVVIVNTCSFIDSAQEESVDTILESAALRDAENRSQALIVAGCLPQRFREELPKLLPEVDAFMGIDQVADVPEIVRKALDHRAERLTRGASQLTRRDRKRRGSFFSGRASKPVDEMRTAQVQVNPRPIYIPDFTTPRFRLTPGHYAFLKIAEGCNHPCSFCTIPRIRGSHRSRPQTDLVQEAQRLLAEGVKELNLISQDSTYYGLDLRTDRAGSIAAPDRFQAATHALPQDATTLCTLLRELNALPGEFWIRLLYTHPAHWTDDLIETIAACPKVARYVDMPLQHIHHNMLERMRRETTPEYIIDLISRIRAGISGITLRTTFIVGFPGESETCFETLIDFIRTTRFERLGVFLYSQEEGTRASKMMEQIPDSVKKRRRRRAMAEQRKVARAVAESYVGTEINVLVEHEAKANDWVNAKISSWEHGLIRGKDRSGDQLSGRYWVARGEADAPDIDGRVYLKGTVQAGEFVRVKIVGHTDYDLIAVPA